MSDAESKASTEPATSEASGTERAHHPDSPSSLQSSEACPLFRNENRETRAATAGTLQHKAAELRDLSILDTDEQVEAVKACIRYVEQVGHQKYASEGEVVVLKEIYLHVGEDPNGEFIGITGGYPDEIIKGQTQADIFDFKFGAEPVTETKNNLQGISYALGLFEKYPALTQITVHFYAPNQGWSEEEQKAKYVHPFHRHECEALELRVRT